MLQTDNAPFELQRKIQAGCGCCSWAGDPFLVVRELPAKYGSGFAVILVQPGETPVFVYRSDQRQPLEPYAADHRVIDYLVESKRAWELDRQIEQFEAQEAKAEAADDKHEIDMTIELSKQVRHHLRKEGKI
jgi:hypothetical protein